MEKAFLDKAKLKILFHGFKIVIIIKVKHIIDNIEMIKSYTLYRILTSTYHF